MAREIFEILNRLNQAGTTILVITHNIDFAATYASRAIVLQEGKIKFDGPIRGLLMNRDLMKDAALEMPQTTRLASLLSRHGVPPWLVTIEQLDHAIGALVEASHDN
jgi:energy-coupling factor transport system ATP-binding protein